MQEQNVFVCENDTKNKSGLPVFVSALLCLSTVICVLFASLILFVAFAPNSENTFSVFGYKVFALEQDIPECEFEGGSLLVVRDTNSDESYTPETLVQNTVFVIKNLGGAIKRDAAWIVICLINFPATFCFLTLIGEIKKLAQNREEERGLAQFTISESDESEISID